MDTNRLLAALTVLVIAGLTLLVALRALDGNRSMHADDVPSATPSGIVADGIDGGRTPSEHGPGPTAAEAPAVRPWETKPAVSFSEHATAVEALEILAANEEYRSSDLGQAVALWQETCSSIRSPNGRLPLMLDNPTSRAALLEFEAYCEGIQAFDGHIEPIESPADVDAVFDRIEESWANPPETWDERAARLGPERALDGLLLDLLDALRNANESRAQGLIMAIIDTGLFPGIEETGPNSDWALTLLAVPLTHAFVCHATDGCRGTAHPLVVRYCMLQYLRRTLLCDGPAGIDEAIYQTLTPVEYDGFLRLYSWINGRLVMLDD